MMKTKKQTNHNINQTAQSRDCEVYTEVYLKWNPLSSTWQSVSESQIIWGATWYKNLKWSTERDMSQINRS